MWSGLGNGREFWFAYYSFTEIDYNEQVLRNNWELRKLFGWDNKTCGCYPVINNFLLSQPNRCFFSEEKTPLIFYSENIHIKNRE